MWAKVNDSGMNLSGGKQISSEKRRLGLPKKGIKLCTNLPKPFSVIVYQPYAQNEMINLCFCNKNQQRKVTIEIALLRPS